MGICATWAARHRLACALPAVAALSMVAQPVIADSPPQDAVNSAQQALQNAQQQATGEDTALVAARQSLAAYTAQLAALQARITTLDATIGTDTTDVAQLQARLEGDRSHLAAYIRQAYENGGSEAALVYIISSKDISTAIQRKEALDKVSTAAQDLIDRINWEAWRAQQVLASDRAARADLAAAELQAKTQQALIAVQTEQVQAADAAAHQAVAQAQGALTLAQAELEAARARDTIYPAVPGATFTIDTDLTQASGETAAKLDSFLKDTPMAGLGDSFMRAEQSFHVSARYFVAHAILESDWGQSAIAHDKHNLFGFNANDANPYQDATTFASFDACIQYVAQFVQTSYPSPSGRFFHGPTLRGMNVDYATDPNWADKIASIAQTIP